jgi:hypothetical protein
MSPVAVAVDAEGAVRDWLKAEPGVVAVVGAAGVWLGRIPEGVVSYPLVVVTNVGGFVDPYLPVDTALLQMDCWGANNRDIAGSGAAARAVANAVWNLAADTVLRAGVVALGASVETRPFWSPDPVSGRARHIVSASFALKATA